jgi:hypothetical protein
MEGTANAPLDADKAITSGMGPGSAASPVNAAAGMDGLRGIADAEAMAHQGKYEDAFRAPTAKGMGGQGMG